MTQEELVANYVRVRDAKAAAEAEHKEKKAKFDALLNKIEGILLTQLNEQGVESIRTEAGTAFKHSKTSVTVSDWDAALDFVRSNDAWHMLDKRLNKTAVQAYKEEHDDLPPGVGWRDEITIQVRRAS